MATLEKRTSLFIFWYSVHYSVNCINDYIVWNRESSFPQRINNQIYLEFESFTIEFSLVKRRNEMF